MCVQRMRAAAPTPFDVASAATAGGLVAVFYLFLQKSLSSGGPLERHSLTHTDRSESPHTSRARWQDGTILRSVARLCAFPFPLCSCSPQPLTRFPGFAAKASPPAGGRTASGNPAAPLARRAGIHAEAVTPPHHAQHSYLPHCILIVATTYA